MWKQAIESRLRPSYKYLQGKRGYEPVLILQGKGIIVTKRIFHTAKGENLTGADFVLSKFVDGDFRIVAIQVKRNGAKPYFEFNQRELDQLERLADSFPNGYYLFIDETSSPSPHECFVKLSEVEKMITKFPSPSHIKLKNLDIMQFCRGYSLFYDSFYGCTRGSHKDQNEFVALARKYVNLTGRVLIELFTKYRPRHHSLNSYL